MPTKSQYFKYLSLLYQIVEKCTLLYKKYFRKRREIAQIYTQIFPNNKTSGFF